MKAFTVPVGLGSIRSFVCLVVLLPFYSAFIAFNYLGTQSKRFVITTTSVVTGNAGLSEPICVFLLNHLFNRET